ncbi:hypothetical protein [Kitasatospora sp. GP82]|uniref:hypothetical protein n=1 Tax=Kitasatospora sp. GP82 TaxID=3035089 RepID=UPI0024731DCF|nr:hypothetical protein [Kitasatospora sp. GP82]MDH6129386.1 hypothetical protein [Kitasatospora sp. GP82]
MAIDTAVATEHPPAPVPADLDDGVEAEVEDDDERAGEDVPERVARVLSEVFRAALPYVIGVRGTLSLVTGTYVIVKNTVIWVWSGNGMELFAPGIARRREAKATAQRAAQRATAKAKGKAVPGKPTPRPKAGAGKRRAAKPVPVEDKAPQEQPQGIEGKEIPAPLLRLMGLGLGVSLVVYYMPDNPAVWMPLVLVPWAVAAWTYAPVAEPKAAKPKQEQANDEDADWDDEEDGLSAEQEAGGQRVLSAEEVEATFRLYVEHKVAARYAEGVRGIKQGVHIEDMLADLKTQNLISDPAWNTSALASYLRRIGIPLRDPLPLTVAGKKLNRIGVDFKELTQALGREPRLPPCPVPDLTPREDPEPAPSTPSASPAQGRREDRQPTPAHTPRQRAG